MPVNDTFFTYLRKNTEFKGPFKYLNDKFPTFILFNS